jgi:hypothetical protein
MQKLKDFKNYWEIIKHVEAEIQKPFIRSAACDGCFLAGFGKLGV